MNCRTCKHWNLRKTPRDLHPLAVCDMGPKHIYVSRHGECHKHDPLSSTQQDARDTWLQKRGFNG